MQTVTPAEARKILTNMRPGVNIELITTEDRLIVSQPTKADIIAEQYGKLVGTPITTSAAAEKYNVLRGTIHKWRNKGYISVIEDDGYRMMLNEADVAYCVDTYFAQKKSGHVRGVPLFDDNGLPYKLKHPRLSEYRQNTT